MGGSSGPSETDEQRQLADVRKARDKEVQTLLLQQVRNMRGGGSTTGSGSSESLG